MQLPDYQQTQAAFLAADIDMSPAEAQGVLLGQSCGRVPPGFQVWTEEFLPADFDDEEMRQQVLSLLAQIQLTTIQAIGEDATAVQLLLPDEAVTVARRCEALRDWCQGFLFGLSYSKIDLEETEDLQEMLQSLITVAQLDAEQAEEDDIAFMEIEEFLRLAVVMFHDAAHLRAPPRSESSRTASTKTVH